MEELKKTEREGQLEPKLADLEEKNLSGEKKGFGAL